MLVHSLDGVGRGSQKAPPFVDSIGCGVRGEVARYRYSHISSLPSGEHRGSRVGILELPNQRELVGDSPELIGYAILS